MQTGRSSALFIKKFASFNRKQKFLNSSLEDFDQLRQSSKLKLLELLTLLGATNPQSYTKQIIEKTSIPNSGK